jgi:hypothetical protein
VPQRDSPWVVIPDTNKTRAVFNGC